MSSNLNNPKLLEEFITQYRIKTLISGRSQVNLSFKMSIYVHFLHMPDD